MTIAVGDTLPDATFIRLGDAGPETVALTDKTKGRKVVIFAVPGAFSSTCQTAHMPGFLRTKDQFIAQGVDEIICVGVNDAFVMKEWGAITGAEAAGITMLADADGSYAKALGMAFDVSAIGFYGRSKRYAMLVDDGVVSLFLPEETRGCETSSAEALLAAM